MGYVIPVFQVKPQQTVTPSTTHSDPNHCSHHVVSSFCAMFGCCYQSVAIGFQTCWHCVDAYFWDAVVPEAVANEERHLKVAGCPGHMRLRCKPRQARTGRIVARNLQFGMSEKTHGFVWHG